MTWTSEKQWSDRFVPNIQQAIAPHFIKIASAAEDQMHATDLMVFTAECARIACRIRRNYYYQRYPLEFTVRTRTQQGYSSELDKFIAGWGTHMFYGFANAAENGLSAWMLCDLHVFRMWYSDRLQKSPAGQLPGLHRQNGDGSSFAVFNAKHLPSTFVIDSWNQQ